MVLKGTISKPFRTFFIRSNPSKPRYPLADKLTPEQRHRCMSHVRAKNTKPELWVRKFLYAHGFRYRLHVKRLPGKPDIVIRRLRTVILVNGCFWHGHTEPPLPSPVEDERGGVHCKYFVLPRTRTEFWTRKIERNKARDIEDRKALKLLGWNVIVIWECQLNQAEIREQTLRSLVLTLSQIELDNVKSRRPSVKKYQMEEEEETPYSLVADNNDTLEDTSINRP